MQTKLERLMTERHEAFVAARGKNVRTDWDHFRELNRLYVEMKDGKN